MDADRDRELVDRCRAGDERALENLIDRYKQVVYALIARTVIDRSRAEASPAGPQRGSAFRSPT
jgi:hypothetical protein